MPNNSSIRPNMSRCELVVLGVLPTDFDIHIKLIWRPDVRSGFAKKVVCIGQIFMTSSIFPRLDMCRQRIHERIHRPSVMADTTTFAGMLLYAQLPPPLAKSVSQITCEIRSLTTITVSHIVSSRRSSTQVPTIEEFASPVDMSIATPIKLSRLNSEIPSESISLLWH